MIVTFLAVYGAVELIDRLCYAAFGIPAAGWGLKLMVVGVATMLVS